MWLEERGTSGDISETMVGCDCRIQPRPLYDALGIETRALGTCKGRRPWLGPGTDQDCNHPYRLLVRSASNAYFPILQSVISLPAQQPELDNRLDAVWNILTAADSLEKLRAFRSIPDVARALDGLTDEEALELIERRRRAGVEGAGIPVRQAEFEILDVEHGTRGRNDMDSPFYAEMLERKVWDNHDPRLANVERVVLVHRLREVTALVGFTRFDAVSLDETGEFDVGVERADLSPEPEWFPGHARGHVRPLQAEVPKEGADPIFRRIKWLGDHSAPLVWRLPLQLGPEQTRLLLGRPWVNRNLRLAADAGRRGGRHSSARKPPFEVILAP